MTDNNVVPMKEAMVLSPPQLLEKALASNANVEVIERLLALQERWQATQDRKEFNIAIAAFKANVPEILKTVEVSFGSGRTSYKHEDLAKVLEVVDPALAAHGLWVRFKCQSDPKLVTVTCVVGHASGYSESDNTLSAAPDTSGSKNAVQAIGSVVTYLQRYTLKSALGLAASKDTDGRDPSNGKGSDFSQMISNEQADQINKILLANKQINVETFLNLAGAPSVSDILAVKFDAALRWLQNRSKKATKK